MQNSRVGQERPSFENGAEKHCPACDCINIVLYSDKPNAPCYSIHFKFCQKYISAISLLLLFNNDRMLSVPPMDSLLRRARTHGLLAYLPPPSAEK